MEKSYPKWWKNDFDEGGKNLYENELLQSQINNLNKKFNYSYNKIKSLVA